MKMDLGGVTLKTCKLLTFIFLLSLFLPGPGCSQEQTAVPSEDSKAQGDKILKEMSAKLASAKSLTFSTAESHDRVGRSGEKKQLNFSREVAIRRPDRLWYSFHGADVDAMLWYDGKLLTAVMNKEKAYAQGPVPATIDEMIDYTATHYDVPMPMADIIESSPYDSLMTPETKGGYAGEETVEGTKCHHLSYQEETVDWQIWIRSEGDPLPCKLDITYKQDPGTPNSIMTFKNWNLAAVIKDEMFVPQIPQGYERIALLEKVTPEEEQAAGKEDSGEKQ